MIIDSINEALSRGASPDQIVQKIKQSNPQKAASFDEALKRGADSKMILEQIIRQNTKAEEKQTSLNQKTSVTDTSASAAFGIPEATIQAGIGLAKSGAETLMTPAKKLSEIQENIGAGKIAEQTGVGIEELTRQSNALNAKYLSLKAGDPMKKQILEDIKRTQGAINNLSKGLSAEKEIGTATDERFKSLDATNTAQAIGKFTGDIAQLWYGGTSKLPTVASFTKYFGKSLDAARQLSRAGELNGVGKLLVDSLGKIDDIAIDFNKAIEIGKAKRAANQLNTLGKTVETLLRSTKSFVTSSARFAPITASSGDKDLGEIASESATAGVFGAAGEALSNLKSILPKTAEKLEEWNLRMTPSQRAMYGDRIKRVTDFLTRARYTGTPRMRYRKVVQDYERMEDLIEGALVNSRDSGIVVDKAKLIQSLKIEAKLAAQDSSEAKSILNEFKRAIENINYQYRGKTIPVDRLNSLKRSAFRNAVDKTGLKILNDVRFKIAEKYYAALNEALSNAGVKIANLPMREFNANYQELLWAKTLLKAAQYRNQTNMFNRLIASFAGFYSGTSFFERAAKGSAAGAALNFVATPTRAQVAKLLMIADEAGIENLPKNIAQMVLYLKGEK